MRIRRITLENYRQFKGRHVIDLSCSVKKGISVIWGGSGFGKTNILNSSIWCLYDAEDRDFGFERRAPHIINSDVFRDCPVGDAVLASVAIEFWDHAEGNVIYSIQRRISATKYDEERLQWANSKVYLRRRSAKSGRWTELSDPLGFVEEFLSRRVTDLSFFYGTALGDLFETGRDSELREAIEREPRAAWLKRIVDRLRDQCSEELSAGERQP